MTTISLSGSERQRFALFPFALPITGHSFYMVSSRPPSPLMPLRLNRNEGNKCDCHHGRPSSSNSAKRDRNLIVSVGPNRFSSRVSSLDRRLSRVRPNMGAGAWLRMIIITHHTSLRRTPTVLLAASNVPRAHNLCLIMAIKRTAGRQLILYSCLFWVPPSNKPAL